MTHVSKDGFEGYPGTVTATSIYQLTADNRLRIVFNATTTQATPINLTNHSYFNLAGHVSAPVNSHINLLNIICIQYLVFNLQNKGHPEIYNHEVTINADHITATDDDSIPTGLLTGVGGTPFDFRVSRNLGNAMSKLKQIGFDDNYCVNQTDPNEEMQMVATYVLLISTLMC